MYDGEGVAKGLHGNRVCTTSEWRMKSSALASVEWNREGDARGRGYGDISIRIADPLCYAAETNTTM